MGVLTLHSLDARAVCVTAGAIALNGDLPAVVDWVRGSVLVYPARAAIAGPLLYHYIGGLRHIAWDHAKCVWPAILHRHMPAAADTLLSNGAARELQGQTQALACSAHHRAARTA
jgi:succinate dehydrogenase/fumarate reductase cytochrome b subunit